MNSRQASFGVKLGRRAPAGAKGRSRAGEENCQRGQHLRNPNIVHGGHDYAALQLTSMAVARQSQAAKQFTAQQWPLSTELGATQLAEYLGQSDCSLVCSSVIDSTSSQRVCVSQQELGTASLNFPAAQA